jgi:aspartate/methionine/tyrosine aminotransferase
MKLSKRAIEIQASPIRKLMPYANSAKAKGVHVYHLNIGQPDIHTPQEMIKVYHEFSDRCWLMALRRVYYRFGGLIDQCSDLSPNWY